MPHFLAQSLVLTATPTRSTPRRGEHMYPDINGPVLPVVIRAALACPALQRDNFPIARRVEGPAAFGASKLNQQARHRSTLAPPFPLYPPWGTRCRCKAFARQLKANAACRLHVPQTNRTNRSNSQHASAEQQRKGERERQRGTEVRERGGKEGSSLESISISDCGRCWNSIMSTGRRRWMPLRGNKQMYGQQTYVIFNNKATVRKLKINRESCTRLWDDL